jgi:hypothetical protein
MEYAAEKGILYQREPRNLASGYKRPVNKLQSHCDLPQDRYSDVAGIEVSWLDLESWVGLAEANHERGR